MNTCRKQTGGTQFTRRHFGKLLAGGVATTVFSGTIQADKSSIVEAAELPILKDSEIYPFVDDLGRQMLLPRRNTVAVPSGVIAQTFLYTLCPDKIASLAKTISSDEHELYRKEFVALPKTGRLSPAKKTVNLYDVVPKPTGVVFDVGFDMDDLAPSMDMIQALNEIPVVFLDISFGKLSQAYRKAGGVLRADKKAEMLATYIETLHKDIKTRRASIAHPPKVLFADGDLGELVQDNNSIQNQVIELLGAKPVTSPSDSLIDTEIDFVIFGSRTCFDAVKNFKGKTGELWSQAYAIQQGNYAIAPTLYHSWFRSPLLTQTIGAMWLGSLLWPDVYDYDMPAKTQEFFSLFYDYHLDKDKATFLVGDKLV